MKTIPRLAVLSALCLPLAGCFGGLKALKVTDFTEQRVTDLNLTKKVAGKRDFIFFSTTKMGVFLDGNIQGLITDYQGNPVEGVTVKVVSDSQARRGTDGGDPFAELAGENTSGAINFSFSPGLTDSMGLYKIHFSVPMTDNIVDMRGKLVYNPGWDQQKINLGKAYEPQIKETPFRLYYNMDSGFLAFAEGVRRMTVEPVGEGRGRMQALPGAKAPMPVQPVGKAPVAGTPGEPAGAAGQAEEDLFKGFDFGQ
ncbi:MAG: hypothetical protein A2285_08200 [Elusimicrobia bacterium RIFOXYA12_FULL_57_11]|nr:MAG: hypothetical protein A2285_08200 [Elusimicrobia bacterium RIFOXYA12_FULL_57_11]